MKNLLMHFIAIFCCNVALSQDIIVTINAKLNNQSVPVDSIQILNLTNNTKLVFNDLPVKPNYQINLSKEAFWGTTFNDALNTREGLKIIQNTPGNLQVQNGGSAERMWAAVYNLTGKKVYEFTNQIVQPWQKVNVILETEGIFLVKCKTKNSSISAKVLGTGNKNNFYLKNSFGQAPQNQLKSNLIIEENAFSFLPGDSIKIMVYKNNWIAEPILSVIFSSVNFNVNFTKRQITAVFKQTPQHVSVNPTPLRYHKKHAITYEQDDNLSGTVETILPLFSGGTPEFDSVPSAGLFFTDGFGTDIPFKTNTVSWVYKSSGSQYWDWAEGGENSYASHIMTYNRLSELYDKGGSLVSHGFRHLDGANDAIVVEAPAEYCAWLENLKSTRPFSFVKGGGQCFNDSLWAQSWFEKGALAGVLGSVVIKPTLRVDSINFNQKTEPCIMGRFSLENKNTAQLQEIVNELFAMEGSNWLRLFSHNITNRENFADYWELKPFFTFIQNEYGKNGSDNVWFPSVGELIQYLHVRDKIKIGVNENENEKERIVVFDVSGIPHYVIKRGITFTVESDAEIDKIEIEGFNAKSKKISNTIFLIDVEL